MREAVRQARAWKWKLRRHSQFDKQLVVDGPDDLVMYIDYDDVNHTQVLRDTRLMVKTLNRYRVRV